MRKSLDDMVAELRADVTFDCQRDARIRRSVVPEGMEPFYYRLITRGHELNPNNDHWSLGEAGFKDGQVCSIVLSEGSLLYFITYFELFRIHVLSSLFFGIIAVRLRQNNQLMTAETKLSFSQHSQ